MPLLKDDTYVVVVEKTMGARLGLDLQSRMGEPWWVKGIDSGLIAKWNLEHPEERVNLGDSLLEVNGVRDLAKVRTTCMQRGYLRLVMRRARPAAPSFDVHFGIATATTLAQPMRGPVRHDFMTESCCSLRSGDEVWDLSSAVEG